MIISSSLKFVSDLTSKPYPYWILHFTCVAIWWIEMYSLTTRIQMYRSSVRRQTTATWLHPTQHQRLMGFDGQLLHKAYTGIYCREKIRLSDDRIQQRSTDISCCFRFIDSLHYYWERIIRLLNLSADDLQIIVLQLLRANDLLWSAMSCYDLIWSAMICYASGGVLQWECIWMVTPMSRIKTVVGYLSS